MSDEQVDAFVAALEGEEMDLSLLPEWAFEVDLDYANRTFNPYLSEAGIAFASMVKKHRRA